MTGRDRETRFNYHTTGNMKSLVHLSPVKLRKKLGTMLFRNLVKLDTIIYT